jgi:hypothetical protein
VLLPPKHERGAAYFANFRDRKWSVFSRYLGIVCVLAYLAIRGNGYATIAQLAIADDFSRYYRTQVFEPRSGSSYVHL